MNALYSIAVTRRKPASNFTTTRWQQVRKEIESPQPVHNISSTTCCLTDSQKSK